MKQNPFSLYDFLGYLIPGSTFIYAYLIIEIWSNNKSDFNSEKVLNSLSQSDFQDIFVFIIAAYSLGHLISFVSSITIEKYGNWRYGYPSKTVIGYVKKSYWVMKEEPSTSETDNYLYEIDSNKNTRQNKNFGRFILTLFILPLFIMEYFVGIKLNFKNFYSKGLDPYLMESIKEKTIFLLKTIKNDPNISISESKLKTIDFNRIVHHYAFENSKEHQFRMVNYVALYGFLRNLVLTFIFAFWFYFILSLKTIDFNMSINWKMIVWNILIMLMSFISFMAYMKFYRRYTLEGLMLIVVDKKIK
ncbi:hypothetical protein [Olleya aquimaris]|uniref:Uncharacterized protein n=1 Tax=Olleya aquimaris TaxID=639310 RepID=A0A327R8Y3_9FLAO|nr:hypothetical protein [Olleya aquimaris]RAJ13386.1 hypothetical protein LY08_01903 [Olleya aquimaris]